MFYYVWDVPLFMCMGAIGGLMGAGFCHFNVKVTQLRHRCGFITSVGLDMRFLIRHCSALAWLLGAGSCRVNIRVTQLRHR